jgi:hypothetical protein
MKAAISLATTVLLTLCLLNSVPAVAQTIKKWTPADIVAQAKPGQWVELEGIVQKDLSVLALEIEFLTGDFMDDDWELKAKVQAVTPTKNELQVLSVPVKVTKDTDFEKGIKSLDDIMPGMLIELDGTYLKDGVFLAKEVENASERLKANPHLDTMVEAVGKVGQVDEAKQSLIVMGIQFHINEKTEGKSLIK